MGRPLGLRLKFHLVFVPVVVLALVIMIRAEYRHELAALMQAHAGHSGPIGSTLATPLDATAVPDVVAARSLRAHVLYAAGLLGALLLAVNAALTLLVLRPAAILRENLSRLERGQWHAQDAAASADELGALCAGFQRLGPEIGALVTQALNAERLATTALVSKRLASQIEPEIQVIAKVAADLVRQPVDHAGLVQQIGPAAGRIVRALHEFDGAFTASRPAAEIRAADEPHARVSRMRRIP